MVGGFGLIQALLLVPVLGGTVYGALCAVTAWRFARLTRRPHAPPAGGWPAVTVLKPCFGTEKTLLENLRSTCRQDYPDYQVVLSAQRLDDPCLPVLRQVAAEFPDRVTLAIADAEPQVNGKVQNLLIGLAAARNPVLVISDSDVIPAPDYLKAIVAPLGDPGVGLACTFYRATRAERWFERLELLTLNADFTANLIFADATGASDFCLGASTAIARQTLERIGGLASFAEYLVEDYEMGRRVRRAGLRVAHVPYVVDMVIDLTQWRQWWNHQVYWDQNTRIARPGGFLVTVLTKAVPFALLFALARLADPLGLAVAAAAILWRLATAAVVLAAALRDRAGLASILLLPVRDVVGLAVWVAALRRRHFVWRGRRYGLGPHGRILPYAR